MSILDRTRRATGLGVILCLALRTAGAEPFTGILDWAGKVALGTPVTGRIERVLVTEGDRVRRDQLLAELDLRPLEAELERARAEVRRLDLAHREARREYERHQALYERATISPHDLQLAEIALAEAAARLAAARAEATRARLALQYAQVRAPFDGIVTRVFAIPGQSVVNRCRTTPILELARADRVRVSLLVSAADAERLQRLERLRIDGQLFRVRLRAIGTEGAGGDYRLTFEAAAPDPAPRLPRLVRAQAASEGDGR
jgi:RND family efflux transporter MFP subunit